MSLSPWDDETDQWDPEELDADELRVRVASRLRDDGVLTSTDRLQEILHELDEEGALDEFIESLFSAK